MMNSNNMYIFFLSLLSLMNKRSGVQSLPISKIDWCLSLIIKSYHYELMSNIKTLS